MYAICILKFAKGHNSVKYVGGIMVLVLSTLSDNALYLYQVLPKYLMGFRVMDLNSRPGRVAQSVGHLTLKSGVLGSIPGLATYFRFSFFFKKGSCQLPAKVCAQSTG